MPTSIFSRFCKTMFAASGEARRPALPCRPMASLLAAALFFPAVKMSLDRPRQRPATSGFEIRSAPLVQWQTETEHDFGEIRAGSVTRFVFRFKNIDNQPLTVETVRTTCGCTAANWTETPVAPGQTGEIAIEYDSEKKGAFRKKIRVFFDHQKKAEILYVEGEVL